MIKKLNGKNFLRSFKTSKIMFSIIKKNEFKSTKPCTEALRNN